MLIRSNQLTLNEASDILDNGVYLTEAEAAINPVAVPVLENSRLGICTVSYNDIQRICEDYGCYDIDAFYSVANSSNIDYRDLAVAIDEADIIMDPDIVNNFPQYVVNPISENSIEYIFTESCLELFVENDYDEDYLNMLDGSVFNEYGFYYTDDKGGYNDNALTGNSTKYTGGSKTNASSTDNSGKLQKTASSMILHRYGQDEGKTSYQQIAELKRQLKQKGLSGKKKNEINNKIQEIKKAMKKKLNISGKTSDAVDAKRKSSEAARKTSSAINKAYADQFKNAELERLKKASEEESRQLRGDQKVIKRDELDSALAQDNERDQIAELNAKNAELNAQLAKAKKEASQISQTVEKAKKSDDPGFISRVVASLRNFYKKFLQKANQEHDSGKIAWYKNFARVILTYIDKLLAKLDKTKQEG